MKTIFTLFILTAALTWASEAKAGASYNITATSNWSTFTIPTTCTNCTINISAGVTLTVDKSVTCQNCTFSGGNISMGSFTMSLQYTGPTTTTFFSNTNFTVTGTGTVTVNAPISLTNSTFSFYGTSSITNSYQFDMVSSRINLYGNSKMTANGGPVNLSSSSQIVIGDGTTTSSSSLLINGYALNIYDNSTIAVANDNNTYQNWSTYSTAPTPAGTKTSHTSFNGTASTNMNCGAGYAHACSNPNLFGPSTLSSAGTTQGATILPILLEGFTGELNSDEMIGLSWTTAQESNSAHFDIERSLDGSVWTIIGEKAAKGYSSLPSNYSFTDEKPSSGMNDYRLRMVDLDGKYTYSAIVVIHSGSLISHIHFFPNPARDYVNIALGGVVATKMTIRLINQSGQILQEKTAVGGNGATVSFPVQQYAAGLYILSVDGSDGTHTSNKVLISRS
jgi:Secretion system C-terminal sorting domain